MGPNTLMDAAASCSAALTARACTTILVEVRTLGGTLVAKVDAKPDDTVGNLKQQVLAGADPAYHQGAGKPSLVLDRTVLPDGRRLNECPCTASFASEGTLVLNLICPRPSTLAAHAESLQDNGAELGGVSDIADAVFQVEYAMSVRWQPRAADVTAALPRETRAQVVAWLGMACEATFVDDSLLHGAVLTLDRYAASRGERMDEGRLLRLSLAALCTEMKLSNEDEFPSGHWQRVLLHLSQERELLPRVLEAEAEMLWRLGFVVGVPTPLTFLNGLALRLSGTRGADGFRLLDGRPGPSTPGAALCLVLARLLIELSLHEAELEYRYPPAVLAAGALGGALLAVGPAAAAGEISDASGRGAGADPDDSPVERMEALHQTLLDDLASYCPGVLRLDAMVRQAELDVLSFWQGCSRGGDRMAECFAHLQQRHARSPRLVEALEFGGDAERSSAAFLALAPEAALDRYLALNGQTTPMDMGP